MAKNKSSATKSTLTEIVNKTVKNRQRRKKLKTVPAVTLPATELLDKKTDLTNEQIAPISEKLKAQNIYRGFTKLAINIKTKRRFQIGFGAILILSLFLYFYIFKDIPSPDKLTSDFSQTTKIFSRKGELLYNIYVDKNRTFVPLNNIPKYVQQATISIEDKDFYKHGGIDPIGGVLRAVKEFVFKQQLQGGSTITQQLVKTALLTPERTIQRKIKEIILASLVELKYPKDKILEMYLNQVPYGGTAWGIEAASERYFNKKVGELSLAESALLAGLPQAPTTYSPFGSHPEYARQRQKLVLDRMLEDKYISSEQRDAALNEDLKYKPISNDIKAPHFVMYVKELLVTKYGERTVEQDGLKVTTTLDLQFQEFAENTIASEVGKLEDLHVTNAASLITHPATGEILAMVGSTDYFASESGTFNATTALRQPGSAIKPINYAIGIENKVVTPASVFNDDLSCFAALPKTYCPVNYDGNFHGPTQLRFALGNSYNIPAVKMLKLNSVETMVASSSAFGITTFKDKSRYGLSLTLGGGEVPMTEMATAFGVFANGGIRKDLVAVLKVEDKNGKILDEYKDANLDKETLSQLLINGPRVVSRETAFLISHILLDQNARSSAFGSSYLQISGHPAVSVKTGTTDDKRDNWTIGFTPEFLVATWVGNNDNSPMNPYLASGVTGAAPIWNKIMTFALTDIKESWPKQPEGIVGLSICPISGLLPPDGQDCHPRYEYFIKGTEPKDKENLKMNVAVDKSNQKLAQPNQTENVEVKEKLVVKDVLNTLYCIDCPHDGDPVTIVK